MSIVHSKELGSRTAGAVFQLGMIGFTASGLVKAAKTFTAAKVAGAVGVESVADDVIKGAGDSQWYKPNGSMNYPPNNGAVPRTEVKIDLQPGQSLGRYGNI